VSMAKHGDVVAIGAPMNDNNGMNSGNVAMFSYSEDKAAWEPLGTAINGDNSSECSGRSVSLSDDGQVVAIGAALSDGPDGSTDAGHARIHAYDSSVLDWIQMGEDIAGEAAFDETGRSVSLSADRKIMAIGAPKNEANGKWSGHVHLYGYDGSDWSQIGDDIDGESAFDALGRTVSLSGDGLVVAIGVVPVGSGIEHVRVYKYTPE